MDMLLYDFRFAVKVQVPYLLNDNRLGEYAPGVAHEKLQQLEANQPCRTRLPSLFAYQAS